MAEKQTKIVEIKVEYNEAIKQIAQYQIEVEKLKTKEKELAKQQKDGEITTEEYTEAIIKSKLQRKQYTDAIKDTEKALNNDIKASKSAEGSLKQLRATLSNLTAQYDAMSKAERESAAGLQLKDKINDITTELKGNEEATQRFQRNVGNYENAVKNAFASLDEELSAAKKKLDDTAKAMGENSKEAQAAEENYKEVEGRVKAMNETQENLNKALGDTITRGNPILGMFANMGKGGTSAAAGFGAMKSGIIAATKASLKFIATPIGAAIAAIAVVLGAFKKGLESSEDNMNKLAVITAPLNRLLSAGVNILNKLVAGLLNIVNASTKAISFVSTMLEKVPIIGKYLKDINDTNEEAIALELEKQNITKQARTNEVDNAKDALEVSKLRKEAKDREKNTAEERIAMLERATKLEEDQAKRNKELATRKFEALKLESTFADNNKETNDELAAAEVAMYNAEKEYFNKTMELQEQMATARNEIKAEEKKAADEEKARIEEKKAAYAEYMATIEEQNNKELTERRNLEDALLDMMRDGAEKQRAEINQTAERQTQDLKKRIDTEKNLTAKAIEAINGQIQLIEKNRLEQLQAITEEEMQNQINAQTKIIEARLARAKEGSDEEIKLFEELQARKMEEELSAAENEFGQLEEFEQIKQEIKIRYAEETAAKRQEIEDNARAVAIENERLAFENEVLMLGDNEVAKLRLVAERKREELNAIEQQESESIEAFNNRKLILQQEYNNSLATIQNKEIADRARAAQAIGGVFGVLQGALQQYGEENKKAARAAKILAIAQMAISQGVAMAQAIATATKSSATWVDMLVAIATSVGAVVSTFATAISTVKSAKFATGGYVSGEGSSTSDSIPARLSNGESVINAKSTAMFAPLLSDINQAGGGVAINAQQASSEVNGQNYITEQMNKAITNMPAPVVSVEEISSITNRVQVLEQISTI